jgi:predicted small metal-binding protein
MLLLDGVRYFETLPKDEEELEQMVMEHASEIFGGNSIYLDLKHKIKSKFGVGSIPDGYVITFSNTPQWYIVEVELSSHPLHEHIVSQISKFISALKNPNTQTEIVSAIYNEVSGDTKQATKLKKAIGSNETYKYLTDCIATTPILTIIIEKDTPELDDALDAINHPIKKVREFRTFAREAVGLAVHVHLFESLNSSNISSTINTPPKNLPEQKSKSAFLIKKHFFKISLKDLIDSKIVKANQEIYGEHKGKTYQGKILENGQVQVDILSKTFDSLSGAAMAIKGGSVDGWRWWNVKQTDGTKTSLSSLREKYEQNKNSPPMSKL